MSELDRRLERVYALKLARALYQKDFFSLPESQKLACGMLAVIRVQGSDRDQKVVDTIIQKGLEIAEF